MADINVVKLASADINLYANLIKSISAALPDLVKLERACNRAPEAIKAFLVDAYHSGGCITFQPKVYRIADIMPVLEYFEQTLDIDFDKSYDSSHSGSRRFSAAGCTYLDIVVTPKENAPGCRRVVVGHTQTPIYKIECLEVVDAPEALPHEPAKIGTPKPAEVDDAQVKLDEQVLRNGDDDFPF